MLLRIPSLFRYFMGLFFWALLPSLLWAQPKEQASGNTDLQAIAQRDGYQAGLRFIENEISRHPQRRLELQIQKAKLHLEHNKHQEAIQIYQRLIRQNHTQLIVFNNLAAIYASQGKLEEAERVILLGIRRNNEFSATYQNLIRIKNQQAIMAVQAALNPSQIPPAVAQLTPIDTINGAPLQPPVQPSAEPVAAALETTIIAQAAPVPPPPPPPPVVTQAAAIVDSELQTQLIQRLQEWAEGWSSGEAERYLSFYSEAFVPEPTISRERWTEQRRQRVTPNQAIQVTIENPAVVSFNEQQAVITFRQFYQSRSLRARSNKQLVLALENGQWKIVSEKIIPR